jgi:hypothetical protein
MSLTFTLNLLFAIAAVGGVLALIDGIIRVRGKAAILAVIEIIVALLFLLSLFLVVSGLPWSTLALAIALLILLVIQLIVRGSTRRGSVALTVVAAILLVIWIVLSQGWIVIPGVN